MANVCCALSTHGILIDAGNLVEKRDRSKVVLVILVSIGFRLVLILWGAACSHKVT